MLFFNRTLFSDDTAENIGGKIRLDILHQGYDHHGYFLNDAYNLLFYHRGSRVEKRQFVFFYNMDIVQERHWVFVNC